MLICAHPVYTSKQSSLLLFVQRLNNDWASGIVLRPFLQPESPLSSQEIGLRLQVQASGFKLTTRILEAAHSNH